jgi:hypothetical protein
MGAIRGDMAASARQSRVIFSMIVHFAMGEDD